MRYKLQTVPNQKKNKYGHFVDTFDKVTVEFDDLCLSGMLEAYERFLRGCGYVFSGNLEIVDNDEGLCDRCQNKQANPVDGESA